MVHMFKRAGPPNPASADRSSTLPANLSSTPPLPHDAYCRPSTAFLHAKNLNTLQEIAAGFMMHSDCDGASNLGRSLKARKASAGRAFELHSTISTYWPHALVIPSVVAQSTISHATQHGLGFRGHTITQDKRGTTAKRSPVGHRLPARLYRLLLRINTNRFHL